MQKGPLTNGWTRVREHRKEAAAPTGDTKKIRPNKPYILIPYPNNPLEHVPPHKLGITPSKHTLIHLNNYSVILRLPLNTLNPAHTQTYYLFPKQPTPTLHSTYLANNPLPAPQPHPKSTSGNTSNYRAPPQLEPSSPPHPLHS